MVRYGIVGAGMMGQEHMRNLALLSGTQITAFTEPDPAMSEAAGALAGPSAKRFLQLGDMLSADICDAYIVATPNDTHHDVLLSLIKAGKPILCEKPLCSTVEDCRSILKAASKGRAPIWVAMEYRYMPPVARLLEVSNSGGVGKPRMMAIREHRYPFLDKVGSWNRFSHRTGGTMVEKCCHFWDLMRLVFGADPVRVFASGAIDVNHVDEEYDGHRPDVIDNAYVIVDFADGQRGMLDLCMFAEGSKWQEIIAVTGPVARVEALIPGPRRFASDEQPHGRVVFSDRATRSESMEDIEIDPALLVAGDHHGSTFFQHERFAEFVRGQSQTPAPAPEVTLEDGLWSVMVGTAAEKSIKSGQPVDLAK